MKTNCAQVTFMQRETTSLHADVILLYFKGSFRSVLDHRSHYLNFIWLPVLPHIHLPGVHRVKICRLILKS